MPRSVVGYVVEGEHWVCVECATILETPIRVVVSYLPTDMARQGRECVDCRTIISGYETGAN